MSALWWGWVVAAACAFVVDVFLVVDLCRDKRKGE